MSRKNVTILCSSHGYALIDGVNPSLENDYTVKFTQEFKERHHLVVEEGEPMLRPDVAEWVAAGLDADRLLLAISGSDWLEFCASNRDPKFDIILPFAPELAEIEDAQLIPYRAMRRRLKQRIRHVVLGIEVLRQQVPASIPIWYIEPPPPIEDNDHIRRTATFAAGEIARHGVTDPLLRLKMYRLHSAIIADACLANGVDFLPVPGEARTGPGFLPPDCVGDDCFHANPIYGARVMGDIDRKLAGQDKP